MKTLEQLKQEGIDALESLALAYFNGWELDEAFRIEGFIEKLKGE